MHHAPAGDGAGGKADLAAQHRLPVLDGEEVVGILHLRGGLLAIALADSFADGGRVGTSLFHARPDAVAAELCGREGGFGEAVDLLGAVR